MISKFAFTGFALLAASSPAAAADLLEPPPIAAPVATAPDWSGLYAGAQIGRSWGTTRDQYRDPEDASASTSTNYDLRGALAGGVLGFNWQTGRVVYGAEASYNWAKITGKSGALSEANEFDTTRIQSFADVRARLGYSLGRALLFINGGAVLTKALHSYNPNNDKDPPTNKHATGLGWSVGAGIEYMLNASWSARAEYNYVDLGRRVTIKYKSGGNTNFSDALHVIKFGLNYHFSS